MKIIRLPYIFVIGNEKGGAGKTTCSMHLISALLERGLKVGSIDTDSRQHSLTTYIQNRKVYNNKNPDKQVPMPIHYLIIESTKDITEQCNMEEQKQFEDVMSKLRNESEVIIIDTPGRHSFLSCLAHSCADVIITPINDSFLDIDVLAKVDPDSLKVIAPSIYSQMVWEQKINKSKRGGSSIEWVVIRNRLSSLDARNKRNISYVLDQLAKRVSFKNVVGFSERVIFKELFLQGLTLLDLTKVRYGKSLNISHIAARQELREFVNSLNIEKIVEESIKIRQENVAI